MKRLIVLKHESGYYWGLGLLLASCLALVWALWRDAFKPEVFLAGLVAFSWGYFLLWRHDVNVRFTALEAKVAELQTRASVPCEEAEPVVWAQELSEVTGQPGTGEAAGETSGEIPGETGNSAETQDPVAF